MKQLIIAFLTLFLFQFSANGQLRVSSSDGYDVLIWLEATSVDAPNSCSDDYTFKVNMKYDVKFEGVNVPDNMYTLQCYLLCDQDLSMNFGLPVSGGVGDTITAPDNWVGDNCSEATPQLLGCDSVRLLIEGPGISVYEKYPLSNFLLPMELINFSVKVVGSQGVLLNWETASELNNDYFAVERSNDGRNWKTLAELKGAGTSSDIQNYDYIDPSPVHGISYYRLRQTDFDGTFKYSKTRTVDFDFENHESKLVVYPNPAQNTIQVFTGKREQRSDITVYNMFGHEMMSVKNIQKSSDPIVSVDISSLQNGVYIVKTGQSVTKFYKN